MCRKREKSNWTLKFLSYEESDDGRTEGNTAAGKESPFAGDSSVVSAFSW